MSRIDITSPNVIAEKSLKKGQVDLANRPPRIAFKRVDVFGNITYPVLVPSDLKPCPDIRNTAEKHNSDPLY